MFQQKHFLQLLNNEIPLNQFAKAVSEAPRDDQDYTPIPSTVVQIRSSQLLFMVQAQVQTEHTNIFQARASKGTILHQGKMENFIFHLRLLSLLSAGSLFLQHRE